ncbi:MAG: CapA family protein [Promethearchaeota archaeon]
MKNKLIVILLIIFFYIISLSIFFLKPCSYLGQDDYDSSSDIEIAFVGDIMLARRIEEKIEEEDNINYPFEPTKSFLDTADYRVGNLECVLSTKGELIESRTMPFQANPEFVEGLKYAGFDMLTLANNHILDFGPIALNNTLDVLNDNKIRITGIYSGEIINFSEAQIKRPVLFEKKGLIFAFLSYAQNPPSEWNSLNSYYKPIPLNQTILASEIAYVKQNFNDPIIIVQIHWRIYPQYNLTCNNFQKKICHIAIDNGANIVSCHGPHTIQEIEAYRSSINNNHKGLIFYSLGNYVFDLSNELSWKSIIVKVRFKTAGIDSISILPIYRRNLQYVPAGNEQIFQYKYNLFLNWTNFENFFKIQSKNSFMAFLIGSIFGLMFSIPILYGFIIIYKNKVKIIR